MFIQGELIYQCEKFLWYYLMFIKHSGSCEYSSLWARLFLWKIYLIPNTTTIAD